MEGEGLERIAFGGTVGVVAVQLDLFRFSECLSAAVNTPGLSRGERVRAHQVDQDGSGPEVVNGQVAGSLEAAGQGHFPTAGDPEPLENTLKRIAYAIMAQRKLVAVTRNKVVSERVQGAPTAGGALEAGIAGEEGKAEPPSQEEAVLAGVIHPAAVGLVNPAHPRPGV
jgi:hypothetical protein